MSDRIARGPGFAFGIAGRVLLIAALGYLALQLILTRHLYATALVLVGIVALLVANLVQRLGSGANFKWAHRATEMRSTAASAQTPHAWQQQIDYRQTLLDTVAAALFVVDEHGSASAVNRAAQRLAGRDIHRLGDVEAIGAAAANALLALPAGTRRIVELADARQSFVSVTLFQASGQPPRRLISLQRIAGELDAIEVKAWQDVSRVLAHEMMNSLTPIASLSESLEQLLKTPGRAATDGPDPELSGALEAIRRRSRGLMEFVERYRQVAQVPAPALQDVALAELLAGIEHLMSAALKQQQIRYRGEVSPAALSCRADPHLLEQALINLIRNAIDAHTAQVADPADRNVDRCIQVLCRPREGQVEIAVIDNGPGLLPGSEDRVFVPFFTTKVSGTGIGLSVARQIALAHAGRLEVRPNAPHGSAFVLTLPA